MWSRNQKRGYRIVLTLDSVNLARPWLAFLPGKLQTAEKHPKALSCCGLAPILKSAWKSRDCSLLGGFLEYREPKSFFERWREDDRHRRKPMVGGWRLHQINTSPALLDLALLHAYSEYFFLTMSKTRHWLTHSIAGDTLVLGTRPSFTAPNNLNLVPLNSPPAQGVKGL